MQHLVDAFAGLEVVVVGDLILDSYLEGASSRLTPEAPVPVVEVTERVQVPGGAGNTIVNLAAMGARVRVLSRIGDDSEGATLSAAMGRFDVDMGLVELDESSPTTTKNRVVCGEHIVVRFDTGGRARSSDEFMVRMIRRLDGLWEQADAIVVSDYQHGLIDERLIEWLEHTQRRRPQLLVVDSKRLLDFRHIGVSAVKPNFAEAGALLPAFESAPHDRVRAMVERGQELVGLLGSRVVALTLDRDGALVFERGKPMHRTFARPVPERRTSGAGDTFIAALTLALAAGADTPAAAELASQAASVVVGSSRTAVCTANDLTSGRPPVKICRDGGELAVRLDVHRRQGERVVFTNGCFDILHRGHVSYLNRAEELGDVLVVGVNSDESVRRLKGPERPLNPLEDRLAVLGALSCIDHLVAFDEDTPARLIDLVRPDVYAKGGDYRIDMLPEVPQVEQLGGEVAIVPYVDDRSTTGLIRRIRSEVGSVDRSPAAP